MLLAQAESIFYDYHSLPRNSTPPPNENAVFSRSLTTHDEFHFDGKTTNQGWERRLNSFIYDFVSRASIVCAENVQVWGFLVLNFL